MLIGGFYMKKLCKRGLTLFVIMCLIVTLVPINTWKKSYALSQPQVNKKIATLQKEIKSLKDKKNKELKKEKKQKRGTISIIGTIISTNPLIVQSSFGNSYYWIKNAKNMDVLITYVSGYVKKTGQTKNYSAGGYTYTCTVVNAVKVSSKSYTYQRKINAKKKQLTTYKKVKKDYFIPKSATIVEGTEKKIKGDWKYNGKYNTKNFKSSNPSIVSVDKNGILSAKKVGKATITATTGISKRKKTCTITVTPKINSLSFEQKTYKITRADLDDTLCYTLKYIPDCNDSKEKVTIQIKSLKLDSEDVTSTLYIHPKAEKTDFDLSYYYDGNDEKQVYNGKIKLQFNPSYLDEKEMEEKELEYEVILTTESGVKATCKIIYDRYSGDNDDYDNDDYDDDYNDSNYNDNDDYNGSDQYYG